ncbi:death regulator Nedd2-like caspase isoform X2 [Arctopsyche grandis]|uniref:death regulator Nedd2-like caspase isoform X2 n=1 Tax=Arctopsyche grandis TaxID=121162 RepID=UPI00406D8438
MQEDHRNRLKYNLSSLVEQTSLKDLLPALIEKDVFTEAMAEKYRNATKTERENKRELFLDLPRRGPDAFDKLVEALNEAGNWSLVTLLDDKHYLNVKPQEFVSLSESRVNDKPQPVLPTSNVNNLPSDDKPIEIKVKKSTTFNESHNSLIGCYFTKSRNRGMTLLINNIDFEDGTEKRTGADVDEQNLKALFHQIGFSEFISHNNSTASGMENALKDFTKSPKLKETDCVFVIIASHGTSDNCNNHVKCSDGSQMSVSKILEYFSNINCPALRNKPKIIIFQLCRGKNEDRGCENVDVNQFKKMTLQTKLNERTQLDGKDQKTKLCSYSDILIVHSTLPGFSSHRDKILGSWFIISMCKVFMEHAYNTNVEELFGMTDEYLKNIPQIVSNFDSVQNASIERWSFNKICFLNPGMTD